MTEPQRILTQLPLHPTPEVSSEPYRLLIDGAVVQVTELSIDDLRALAGEELAEDFACLEGWVVPGQVWAGVPLSAVLRLAQPSPQAAWVRVSFDSFVWPLPIERAGDALLALDLNGGPLTREHGAPVRLVVRGGECFTSVKWVDRLELSTTAGENTAEQIARARIWGEPGGPALR